MFSLMIPPQAHTRSSILPYNMSSGVPSGGDVTETSHDISKASASQKTHGPNIALKILVSNGIAGSIIGRAGSTISELQSLSGSRIKLSQAGECFPGTNERVCLVQGDVKRMKAGIDLILQRFILANADDDENDGTGTDSDKSNRVDESESDVSQRFQLKVLIPSSACGLLIGRNGRHIKSLGTTSQTRIQLGQKEEISSITTAERIFSIQGGKENILQCMELVISCIEKEMEEVGGIEENSVWRYVNMTTGYSKAVSGAAKNSTFSGRVILPRETPDKRLDRTLIQQHQGSGLLSASPGQVVGGQITTSNPQVIVGNTAGVLNPNASTGPLQQGRGSGVIDFASLPTSPASAASISHAASQVQMSSTMQLFKVEESPQATENSSPTDAPHTVTLAIPDPLIGSIIGHNGSTLTQLQLCSQTRIQISQRGEHVPGTNQRLVRITGNTKENCDAAQFWIGQRMTMAQSSMDTGGRGTGGQRRRHQNRGGRGGRVSNEVDRENDQN